MQAAPGGVLCLDTGTSVGWCYGSDVNAVPAWGVWKLTGIKSLPESFVGLTNELADAVAFMQPRRVVYEAPLTQSNRDQSPQIPLLLIGLAMHVESECYRLGVQCFARHIGEVRKLVIGKGGFAKPFHGEGKMRTTPGASEPTLRGDAKEEVRLWASRIGWQSITDPNARDAAVLLRHELMFADAKIMAGAGSR